MKPPDEIIAEYWSNIDTITKQLFEEAGLTKLIRIVAEGFFYAGRVSAREEELARLINIRQYVERSNGAGVQTPPAAPSLTAHGDSNSAGLRSAAVGESPLPPASQRD